VTTQTPPDWYPDPHDEVQVRYWDGQRWTDHVAQRQQPTQAQQPAVHPRRAEGLHSNVLSNSHEAHATSGVALHPSFVVPNKLVSIFTNPDRNHFLSIRLDQNNRVTSCWLMVDEGYEGDTEKDRRDRLETMLRYI
jgi:hypothetical protein